jgi:hypothetical protein
MKNTDSRPAFIRRQSCLLRIEQLDRQLADLVEAKAAARRALAQIEAACGEEVTLVNLAVAQ